MVGQRPTLKDDGGPPTADGRPGGIDIGDVAALLGLALLAIGLAFYDWRLAAVVCGAIILSAAVVGAWRAGHGGK